MCRSWNRSPVRFLLACALAKAHQSHLDIRKPYAEIGAADAYSGRNYDERYVDAFIKQNDLPANPTTAFLTPAFRTKNVVLTPSVNLGGKPPELYKATLDLLNAVSLERLAADDLLCEVIRILFVIREENRLVLGAALTDLAANAGTVTLSSEDIVSLVQQHMASPRASRLPVLAIAAIYRVAATSLGERVLTLQAHNAADSQTGATGDVEIALLDDDNVITVYEMKDKRVTRNDIDNAVAKVRAARQTVAHRIQNYIFITTEVIEDDVQVYARGLYEKTSGVEFVILDCIGFLRSFLHLFHRRRIEFLDAYQMLVLADGAVGQPLKESLLTLRRAAGSQLAEQSGDDD